MPVRLTGTIVGALAIGTLVVACATKDPTTPMSARQVAFDMSGSSACSPDVTPPSISSITVSPNVLWPPNHRLVPVTVSWNATDNCSTPACAISSISSNEPVNGLGDGNTSPDWIITSGSTALVRAERSGTGTGRVYTITVSCRDAAGNTASRTVTVLVPHDQGHRAEKCAKDDHGAGDDKRGDRDLDNKCKQHENDDDENGDRG